jgi:thioredoxin 1
MKEKIILIVVIILMIGLVGGATMVMNLQDNSEVPNAKIESGEYDVNLDFSGENKNEIPEEQVNEVTITYVTDETFENEVLKSEKTVVVDFYADWCGPCKTLAPILQEFANENPDIKVVKLNVDENQITSMNYSVYSIPTLVVIKDGVETNRLVGAHPKENIEKAVEYVKE